MNQTADNAENTPVSMPEGNRKENDMEEKKKGFFSRLVEGLNQGLTLFSAVFQPLTMIFLRNWKKL